MFFVKHTAYCGLTSIPREADDLHDARTIAARRLRSYRRHGFPIATLTRGEEWEILEPDDCQMIPDACGILWIEHEQHECPECGSEHETTDEALHCCAPAFDDPDDYEFAEQDIRETNRL